MKGTEKLLILREIIIGQRNGQRLGTDGVHELKLLCDEVIERRDLILQVQSEVVPLEEVWILLFQFLPHERSESGVDMSLLLECNFDFGFAHVQIQAPLYQRLYKLNVFDSNFL